MAGDDEKKKKKKSKKEKVEKAEDAPPPEPEPEPAAAPAAPAPAGGDEGFDWLSEATAEAPAPVEGEAPPAEGEAAPAEEAPVEGVEGEAEPPPAPKKKPKFFVHWNRRKARFYDYNFDYGENYYSSMIKYVDSKSSGVDVPRRMAFAERGIYSSLARKSAPDSRTDKLLSDVRTSIKNLESSQRTYMWEHKKVV